MRISLILFFFITSFAAQAQDTLVADMPLSAVAFKRNTYTATLAVGFVNSYRADYSVPSGFEKGNATGFAPVYARLEYAVSNRVSLAFTTSFNTVIFNSFTVSQGNNGEIRRFTPNKMKLFGGGLSAYYHFGYLLKGSKLDPFIGAGINLNKITNSALPTNDGVVERKSHSAVPSLRAGLRYYISPKFSAYADGGYDKLSVFSLGFSCRFLPHHKAAK